MLSFQRPTLPSGPAIERYLARSRSERWFSNCGPCWRLLRERLAAETGAHCVPVASGTVGLMAAIATLVEPRSGGGEALMPSFTFSATAQAAIWAGLTPRYIDVDAAHWHLDPGQLEQELAARPQAALVVAVTAFGTPAPAAVRRRWEAACRAAGVPLLVDSAAAFGARTESGAAVGRQGDAEVVSFHATKPFAIGEGGAVFTDDPQRAERVVRAVNFGLDRERSCVSARGLNGKMSELHAAVGLAVLDTFPQALAARRAAAERLRAAIGGAVSWQEGCERGAWQFVPVAFPDGASRRACVARAAGRVEVRGYYQPLHRMAALAGSDAATGGLRQTEALAARMLCLPMAGDLTDAELTRIAEVVVGSA